jgi:hypothetical protein
MKKTRLITLSAEEIINLIREKVVQKDGVCFSSSSSFLTILALLDEELVHRLPNARSAQS